MSKMQEVEYSRLTLARAIGEGWAVKQDGGRSSWRVADLSLSRSRMCSCPPTISTLRDSRTGPIASSTPTQLLCSCNKSHNHKHPTRNPNKQAWLDLIAPIATLLRWGQLAVNTLFLATFILLNTTFVTMWFFIGKPYASSEIQSSIKNENPQT